jgi:hypothetical protein
MKAPSSNLVDECGVKHRTRCLEAFALSPLAV